MPLGMEVGLGLGDIVLHGVPVPEEKGTAPNFRPNAIVAKRLDGSRCHLIRRWLSAQATLCQMGTQLPLKRTQPPTFRPMSIVAKRSTILATAGHL